MFSPTGLSPSTADHPRPLRLTHRFLTAAFHGGERNTDPTTPHTQPPPGITCLRFSHPPRSLATTSGITICFLLLRVLRCFTSPRSPSPAIHSPVSDTTSLVPGYPIRTSSDPRSVDNSPRHIAASHVLHRLSMPRHPPCALTHLQTQKPIDFKIAQTNTHPHGHAFIRCSQPLSNYQTPHPTTKRGDNTRCCLRTQQCVWRLAPTPKPGTGHVVAHPVRATTAQHPFTAGPSPDARTPFVVLPRKEVIQPHLPVRLPCYDFVPIADPTFDSSPHKG
jgi:hypothetical protein